MPRAKKPKIPPDPPRSAWHVHVGRDSQGNLDIGGYDANSGMRWLEGKLLHWVAIIDVGRPFVFDLRTTGKKPQRVVVIERRIDGGPKVTEPWTAGELYFAARKGMFGFSIYVEDMPCPASEPPPSTA